MTEERNRDSRIELLRIIAMLLIIAHHLVTHSGVENLYEFGGAMPPAKMVFLQIFGMWGKTMVNVFVIITGWFMCTSSMTVRRFAKVYLEVKFYRLVIYFLLALAGAEVLSGGRIYAAVFSVLNSAGADFSSSFLVLYLLIPFLNTLMESLGRKRHTLLVCLLLCVYTVSSTFFFNYGAFSEIGWFVTLYLTAARLRFFVQERLDPERVGTEKRVNLFGIVSKIAFPASAVLSVISILVMDRLPVDHAVYGPYYFVSDSSKLLAFTNAVSLFLLFLGWYDRTPGEDVVKAGVKKERGLQINRIAACVFGVYLIHDNSDAVRDLLWHRIFRVAQWYDKPLPLLILLCVLSVFAVFAVCAGIDYLRIRFLEPGALALTDKAEALIRRRTDRSAEQ